MENKARQLFETLDAEVDDVKIVDPEPLFACECVHPRGVAPYLGTRQRILIVIGFRGVLLRGKADRTVIFLEDKVNSNQFRKELIKIMPGYKWTVHRPISKSDRYLSATGIQTSGFNRLSTLEVTMRKKDDSVEYDVRSSGFGLKAPWLSEYQAPTLARALRGLQNHYETVASNYASHAADLRAGRRKA